MRALVTGASEGIGREFAKQLAAKDYQITAVARNEERLKSLVAELGEGHDYLVADLMNPDSIAEVVARLHTEHYELLVNNAGFGVAGKFHETEWAKSQGQIRLNIEALVHLASAYLSQAKDGDALINVSSTLAFMPAPTMAVYAATKSFVTSFSEALWYENKGRGVYVQGLCPGATETNFFDRSGADSEKRPPKAIFQTADQVVNKSLSALKARSKPTVISGAQNWALANLLRAFPRKTAVKMIGSSMS